MQNQGLSIMEIGEPRIDVLPQETADYFYTTLLTRITELIQNEQAEKEQPPVDNVEV